VERHGELALLIVAACVGAGLFTTAQLSGIVERRRKAHFIANLVPPGPDAPMDKIILYAILSESKVEFLYKGRNDFVPQLRIVTPTYSSVTRTQYGSSGAPCIVGHCHIRNARRTFVLDRISALKLHGA
jgi:predicted DNA-binding transcriptional regulator YafY